MAAVTRFVKTDTVLRSSDTTAAELTNYTVAFSDLTGAGFAAGDDVLILVGVKLWGSSANGNFSFAVGFGTTFAGRTEDTSSVCTWEPALSVAGAQYLWFDRKTLVANENIYFRGQASTGNGQYQEFVCTVLKLGDLTANDFLYAENAPGANSPASYGTTGAGTTVPQTGNWLLLASVRFDCLSASSNAQVAIHDGTSDVAEVIIESEDAVDFYVVGTMAYRAGLASGATVRVRHLGLNGNTFQTTHTRIFGLRLGAFADHAGQHTTNTVTHSVLDTYSEVAGFGAYGLTTTGPFMVLGWPIHTLNEVTKRPYGRIQIGEADWPTANANRVSIADNRATAKIAPLLFGYAASQSSGTLDIDLDAAEDADVSPSYNCTEQVAVAFSLTLAVAGATVILDTGTVGAAGTDLTVIAPRIEAVDTGTATASGSDLAARLTGVLDTGALTAAGADLAQHTALVADIGTVTSVGVDLTILAPSTLALDQGTVTATGQDAVLGLRPTLDSGTTALTGSDVTVLPPHAELLETGLVAVAGTDLALPARALLDTGGSTAAGTDLVLLEARTLAFETGTVALSGESLTPLGEGEELLDNGTIAISGVDLAILAPATVAFDTGLVAAASADLGANLALLVDVGSGQSTGQDLAVLASGAQPIDTGSIELEGNDLGIVAPTTLVVDSGAIAGAGENLAAAVALLLEPGVAALAGFELEIAGATVLVFESKTISMAGSNLNVVGGVLGSFRNGQRFNLMFSTGERFVLPLST